MFYSVIELAFRRYRNHNEFAPTIHGFNEVFKELNDIAWFDFSACVVNYQRISEKELLYSGENNGYYLER